MTMEAPRKTDDAIAAAGYLGAIICGSVAFGVFGGVGMFMFASLLIGTTDDREAMHVRVLVVAALCMAALIIR